MTAQQLEATRAMLTWLRAAGAEGLDNVEVKRTAYGGLGVFLAAPVETTSIARIPVECCVTATAALTRPVGQAAREILPDCADEFVLVLDAATGRRDATHPQHAYLASLPAGAQHVATFPKAAQRLLKHTALGARVERARHRWSGVLIEAGRDYIAGLREQRTCRVSGRPGACCWLALDARDNATRYWTVHDKIVPSLKTPGSYKGRHHPDAYEATVGDRRVRTRRLSAVLRRFEVAHVDYLSADCEGCETAAPGAADVGISIATLPRRASMRLEVNPERRSDACPGS